MFSYTRIGTVVGSLFGPVGTVVGVVIGAIIDHAVGTTPNLDNDDPSCRTLHAVADDTE